MTFPILASVASRTESVTASILPCGFPLSVASDFLHPEENMIIEIKTGIHGQGNFFFEFIIDGFLLRK